MCIYHTSFILTLIQKRKSCIKMTIVLRHLRPYNGSHIVSVPVSVYFLRLFRCCRFFPPIFFFSVSIIRWTCSCVFMFVYQHRVIIFSSKLFFFSAVDWARFVPFVCPLWAAEAISLPRRISLLHSLLAIIYSQSMLFLFCVQQHTQIALLPFIIFLVHVANKIYRSILSNVCLRSCSFVGVSAPHNNSKHFSILFPFDMINRNGCDEKFNARMFQSELRSSMGNIEYTYIIVVLSPK